MAVDPDSNTPVSHKAYMYDDSNFDVSFILSSYYVNVFFFHQLVSK